MSMKSPARMRLASFFGSGGKPAPIDTAPWDLSAPSAPSAPSFPLEGEAGAPIVRTWLSALLSWATPKPAWTKICALGYSWRIHESRGIMLELQELTDPLWFRGASQV